MATLEIEDFEAFRKLEGQPFPDGEWLVVTQDMINDFAKATLDFQWIHVDVDRAAQFSPFKKTIAHGFMSVALLSKLIGDLYHVKTATMGVNYGLNKVRFPSPVLVDSRLKLKGTIAQIEDYHNDGLKITWNCIVKIQGSDKPACVAEIVSLMF